MKLLGDYREWVEGKDAGYNLRTTDREGGKSEQQESITACR